MGITLLKHLFEIKRFYAYVKQIQYFGKSNGNTFSFIPHVCYFSYHLSIAASEAWNLTTLFATKMRGRKHSNKNINIPVFQICSRNNKTSLLLYACEVIYLINKGVISPYVQEQGEMLLKFNILHLHYVTHY